MFEELKIVKYPAPVLRESCGPAWGDEVPSAERLAVLAALVERMGLLVIEQHGVGLAAPQVGIAERLFIVNLSGEPGRQKAYVNPHLVDLEGQEEAEEGCLSIPGVNVLVRRAASVTIQAFGLDGQPFEERGEGLTARVWQHEQDHLNGRLILDYMNAESKLVNRRAAQELRDEYDKTHKTPTVDRARKTRSRKTARK